MRSLVLLLFLTSCWMASSAADQSVSKSLSDVWSSFGDLAGSLYTIEISPPEEDRGNKGNMIMPLMIGFKAGGAIMSAMTALKLLVLKTLAVSGLAFLVSLAIAGKYVYDNIQQPLYETTPVHYPSPHIEAVNTWEVAHEAKTNTDEQPSQDSGDLSAYYSSPVTKTINGTQTTYGYESGKTVSQISQRKHFRASQPYRTTIYKTTRRG